MRITQNARRAVLAYLVACLCLTGCRPAKIEAQGGVETEAIAVVALEATETPQTRPTERPPVRTAVLRSELVGGVTKQVWVDAHGDVRVCVAAEIRNWGDVAFQVYGLAVHVLDAKGALLGEMPLAFLSPGVVAPGESGFVGGSTTLKNVREAEEVGEIELRYTLRESDEIPRVLPVEDVQLEKGKDGALCVRGKLRNDGEDGLRYYSVVCPIWREENLEAVFLFVSTDLIAAGGEITFEAKELEFPGEFDTDGLTAEAFAYEGIW